ncbi:hypothetical protein CROQUDRAFT_88894 [Cronartium quercuum f. sp. fusiforme G11]|uniref:Uncharacterized protein n=1 Tax=Cronartium quercuum f. sp. fusiforme G11 TaxID=708437 RepID=A0A9P6NP12_9BASI|nr:hypothetical protein CROQUDRAFT_88894 [Cronartium quercuum f. sp. fusiforme G11]
MPPPPPPDPRWDRCDQADYCMDLTDASNTQDTRSERRSWADEVAEAESNQPTSMEDDLMDAWLEATKHTGADGNVVLSSTVVKLVTALLRKVTAALKDSRQAHQRVDRLEARLKELTARHHPLPLKPTSWAGVIRPTTTDLTPQTRRDVALPPPPPTRVTNEFKASALVIRRVPDQTPFEGQSAAQIVQNINLALRSIDAKLGDQEVKAIGVAVLKPSGGIKIYTATRAMARWLLENKHRPSRRCTYHTRVSVKTIKIYRTELSGVACASKDFISKDPTTSKCSPNASNATSWATSRHTAGTSQCVPNAASPTTRETVPWRTQPQPVPDLPTSSPVHTAPHPSYMTMSQHTTAHPPPALPPDLPFLDPSAPAPSSGTPHSSTSPTAFCALQLNCHKKLEVTHQILTLDSYDTLLLQEPWVNPINFQIPSHTAWHAITPFDYQARDYQTQVKTCIYIRRTIPTSHICQLPSMSPLLTAVEVWDNTANGATL